MIGRGTRLCENLFAPGKDKKEFIVFDYCQNLEFFDANPEGYKTKVQESIKQKIFKRRLEMAIALQNGQPDDAELNIFLDNIKDQLHSEVDVMNLDNFIVRKQRQLVEGFSKRERWQKLTEEHFTAENEYNMFDPWTYTDQPNVTLDSMLELIREPVSGRISVLFADGTK